MNNKDFVLSLGSAPIPDVSASADTPSRPASLTKVLLRQAVLRTDAVGWVSHIKDQDGSQEPRPKSLFSTTGSDRSRMATDGMQIRGSLGLNSKSELAEELTQV
jgi:hypothetical protein